MDAAAPEPAVATAAPGPGPDPAAAFEAFFRETEPKLRRALVAAYGPDLGRDAASEALAYAWEHWERLSQMANLPGYLFRVGQTRGTRSKRQPILHDRSSWPEYQFERPCQQHSPRYLSGSDLQWCSCTVTGTRCKKLLN